MRSQFLEWYTQAIGGIIGVFVCIYSYLNGWMFVYGNINQNFDHLNFGGVISSYCLLPLCLITLFLGIIKSFSMDVSICNIHISSINKVISIITVIVGILGAKFYFFIPAIFILFYLYKPMIKVNVQYKPNPEIEDYNETEQMFCTKEYINTSLDSDNILALEGKSINSPQKNIKYLETRKIMALELLDKNSDLEFIMELTGLTFDEIQELKK